MNQEYQIGRIEQLTQSQQSIQAVASHIESNILKPVFNKDIIKDQEVKPVKQLSRLETTTCCFIIFGVVAAFINYIRHW